MADRLELSGDSEARGRIGWFKLAHVVRREGAYNGELRFDFFFKMVGKTAPVVLALSPADRAALARFLVDGDGWAQSYRYWRADRERISEQEASGNFPPADEWHGSDDWAVDLLVAAAGLLGIGTEGIP